MKPRAYIVWIKGERSWTETTIFATHKTLALIQFASNHGLKTYQCDALLRRA